MKPPIAQTYYAITTQIYQWGKPTKSNRLTETELGLPTAEKSIMKRCNYHKGIRINPTSIESRRIMQQATRQIPITIKGCIHAYDTTKQGNIDDAPDYYIEDIRNIATYIIPQTISILGQTTSIQDDANPETEAIANGWMRMGILEDEWECTIESNGIPDAKDITIKEAWYQPDDEWGMNAIIIEYQGTEYKARNYPESWDNRIRMPKG